MEIHDLFKPLVYILILNWNDAPNSLACLDSIYELNYPNYRVLVVDNGSEDRSYEEISRRFPNAEMILNESNLGFCGGANVGLQYSLEHGAQYVLLINNDTVLDKIMLDELVTTAEEHPEAGLLTPKIYYHNQPNLVWAAGARWLRFPPRIIMLGFRRLDHPRYDVCKRVDAATGCALLIPRRVLEDVGGFDLIYYPIYYEDYDLCERVRLAGWEIWYVPASKLWHKESQSQRRSGVKAFNMGQNVVPFYLRFGSPPLLSLYLFVGWVIAREMVKGNFQFAKPFLRGVKAGLEREKPINAGG